MSKELEEVITYYDYWGRVIPLDEIGQEERYITVGGNYNEYKYCHNCGQKLDWS